MQLGRPKKQTELMKTLQKEGQFSKGSVLGEETKEEVASQPTPTYNPLLENVQLEVEEKVNCAVTKEGDVEKFEVKGIIFLTVNDPKKTHPVAKLAFTPIKGFVFKPHPDIDKKLFDKQKLI
mmetsp:Transcript_9424/g.7197  ORF Transcript_9424/g.7197 Transcript_9424/m.7197 type:complete len:122 (+) Transcript_9424:693-1058(+)